MTSIEDINKQIAKLKTGTVVPNGMVKEKNYTIKNDKNQIIGKKREWLDDNRKYNGGTRGVCGRKPLEQDEKRKSFKSLWEEFGGEEVEVRQVDKGTKEERVVKMARCKVVMDRIYTEAAKGDIAAAKEFNDRVGGKVPNKIVGDSDEAPILMQQIDINNALEKTYGQALTL